MNSGWNLIDNEWYYRTLPDSYYKPNQLLKNIIKPIQGKFYAFDKEGKMLKGFMSYYVTDTGEKCPDLDSIRKLDEITLENLKNAPPTTMYFSEDTGEAVVGEQIFSIENNTETIYFEIDEEDEPVLSLKNAINNKLYDNGILVYNHNSDEDFLYVVCNIKVLCKADGTIIKYLE